MKLSYVSLAIVLVACLGLEGCTKKGGDKKKEASGDDAPADDTGADDSTPEPTCLALQDDEEADADTDGAGTDTEVTEEATDGDTEGDAESDSEGDEDAGGQEPLDESGVGSTDETGCPPAATDDGGTPGTGGGWDAGKGLEGCNEEGKAWTAVVGGGAAQCGGALVDWCCTRAEALKRFPTLADKLSAKFDEIEKDGLKLYNCSAEKGVTFHFAIADESGVHYKTVYTNQDAKAGDPKDASCVAVTSADLGVDKLLSGGDDDDDDEADDDEEASDIPATIGELTDADDKDAIRDWLKTTSNFSGGTWIRDPAGNTYNNGVHAGATNVTKSRTYYNKKMQDGFADADAAKKLPVGSLAIKRLYNADDDTIGYVLMGKAKDEDGKDSWLFFEVKGDTADAWETKTANVYSLGEASCVTCHTGAANDREFIKNTP